MKPPPQHSPTNNSRTRKGRSICRRHGLVTIALLVLSVALALVSCSLLLDNANNAINANLFGVAHQTHQTHQYQPPPKQQKPYFILHVGPSKTATTSIQFTLQEKFMQRALALDQYAVLSTEACDRTVTKSKEREKMHYCFHGLLDRCVDTVIPQALNTLWTQQNLNPNATSIIASSEFMYEIPLKNHRGAPEALSNFVASLSVNYKVVIVALHRNFVDRTLSLFTEKFKNRSPLITWPGREITEQYRMEVDPLLDFVHDWIDKAPMDPYAHLDLKLKLNLDGASLQLLDYHVKDPVEDFFCHALPGAAHACQAYQAQETPTVKNAKPPPYYIWDHVVVAAREQGLLQSFSHKRRKIVTHVANALEVPRDDEYWTCPNATQVALLWNITERGVRAAHCYYPRPPPSLEEALTLHRERFQTAQQGHKWCQLNATALLSNTMWRSRIQQALSSSREEDNPAIL